MIGCYGMVCYGECWLGELGKLVAGTKGVWFVLQLR